MINPELIEAVKLLTAGEMMILIGHWTGRNIPQVNYMTCCGHIEDGVPLLRFPIAIPRTPSGPPASPAPPPPSAA